MKHLILIILVLALAISGCQDNTLEISETSISNELRIFNWDDYFAEDTISNFENEYNITVILETYDDEEQIASRLQSDPTSFDIVFPASDTVEYLVDIKLLSPIDTSKLSNLDNLNKEHFNSANNLDTIYAIPYTWGTTGIMYNSKYIDETELNMSWNDLWYGIYKNKTAIVNNPYVIMAISLKSLNYSINSIEADLLNEAKHKGMMLKSKIIILDIIDIRDKLISEELILASVYSGDGAYAIDKNPNLKYYIPSEGSDKYYDVMGISKGSKNKENALLFIDYILRPKVQAEIGIYSGYAIPNEKAISLGLIPNQILKNTVSYPSKQTIENLEDWKGYIYDYNTEYVNELWSYLNTD